MIYFNPNRMYLSQFGITWYKRNNFFVSYKFTPSRKTVCIENGLPQYWLYF
jgi:hypothetical protein